jgi:hypothetical protein
MSHGPRWLAGPPWSSDQGRPWAHRSCTVWLLRSTGACCDEGKRERGATQFSPRASATGEEAELSWQQWTMVVVVLTSTAKRRGNGEVEPKLGVEVGPRQYSRAPFIGLRKEWSGQDVKGNGEELQWFQPYWH